MSSPAWAPLMKRTTMLCRDRLRRSHLGEQGKQAVRDTVYFDVFSFSAAISACEGEPQHEQ
eukprot:12417330-Karenia_brevis.AAC.1